MTKLHLGDCYVQILHEKLNLFILKKDHSYEKQFLKTHATVSIFYI